MGKKQNITDEVIDLLLVESKFIHSPEGVPFGIVNPTLSDLWVKLDSMEIKDQIRMLAYKRFRANLKSAPLL